MRVSPFLTISLAVLLAACETTPRRPETGTPADARAEMLLEQGSYEQAALEYLRLANQYPDAYWSYRLDAARAFIMELEFDRAEAILDDPAMAEAGAMPRFHRELLKARIALLQSRPETALELLDISIPDEVPRESLVEYYQTRIEAHELQDNPQAATLDRIRLGVFLSDPEAAKLNTGRIWSYLLAARQDEMAALAASEFGPVAAWLELAAISRSLLSEREQLRRAVEAWIARNPRHPAHPLVTGQILAISEQFNRRPASIALLLPMTGIYERYSERIRDGFLSAWFAEAEYKPGIRVYDTEQGDIQDIYRRAMDEGADFIVGPLEKDAVRVLSRMEAIPVRTLALNQIDTAGVNEPPAGGDFSLLPDLVQYGLPPEDEARQVARRGISEGYGRALVITSADEYGDRVYSAFDREWTAGGGVVLERVNYSPQTSDFISPVKQLLNIDASEDRINTLRQRLGMSLSISSRLRQDADFIFMVASNLTARQIVPHLKFFRTGTLPIYTISYVYTGRPNPQVDSDLNGVEFVDMPWILRPEDEKSPLHRQIHRSWDAASTVFPRYYAFGIDAFRLISRIGDLSLNQTYQYPGETGRLYMGDGGVIHRNLSWARFVDGVPRPIETGTIP